MKRIVSLILSAICFANVFFSVTAVTASAATTTATIKDMTIILRNEKTEKCLNSYGGGTYNGNKTTLWKYSKGDTDLWIKAVYRDGGYKLFDHELRIVVGDVYRGSKTKAAAGMKIDAWQDEKSENDFQIWIFERQSSNGSYILRLKSKTSLALGITKNKNGAELQLVKYNNADASQRWYVCGTDGKKLSRSQVEGASGEDLVDIPADHYKAISTYAIGSVKYQCCSVTKAWGSVSKGTVFFLKKSSKTVVADQATQQKLKTIHMINQVRNTYISTLESLKSATMQTYECAASWNRNEELAKLLGTAGGAGLRAVYDCTTGNPALGLINCGKTIAAEMMEPETVLSCTSIVLLKALSANTVYYCGLASSQLGNEIVTYADAVAAAESIALATAYYYSTMKLGRPILDDIVASSPWETTLSNLGMSLLEGALGDTIGVIEAASIVQNISSINGFFVTFGVKTTFDTKYNQVVSNLILG